MAYSLDGFYPDGRGGGYRVHTYTTSDIQSVVEASGYFDSLSDILQEDDIIACLNTGDNINYNTVVDGITSAGVVTTRRQSIITAGFVTGSGATVTLTEDQSGRCIDFDRLTGIIYTLPVAQVGLNFRFITTVNLDSNTYAVTTGPNTEFIVGAVVGAIEGAATDETHFANGTTHTGISSNKTTTGGLIGGWLEFECILATLWTVKGVLKCTATPAPPFTTG